MEDIKNISERLDALSAKLDALSEEIEAVAKELNALNEDVDKARRSYEWNAEAIARLCEVFGI